jgi:hypothetical protein
MADIDVVPKHHSNMWLWIVLAIVVVAILFWAFAGRTHAAARLSAAPAGLAPITASVNLSPVVA